MLVNSVFTDRCGVVKVQANETGLLLSVKPRVRFGADQLFTSNCDSSDCFMSAHDAIPRTRAWVSEKSNSQDVPLP